MVVRAAMTQRRTDAALFQFLPQPAGGASAKGRGSAPFGEVRGGFFGAEMVHPRFRKVGDDEPLPTEMTPIYPSTAGWPIRRCRS
jgi:ATP-dependent DNA helicase RecG